MRFSAYILFLLAVCIPLFLFGYDSMATRLLGHNNITVGNTNTTIINDYTMGNRTAIQVTCATGDIYCNSTSSSGAILWAILALILGFIGVNLLLGFAAMYVIPALIMLAIINLVIIPYDFLLVLPHPIDYILFAVFNIITITAVVDFIRGGA